MNRQALYRAEQVRELDRRAIEDHGLPGYSLMCRAGAAVYGTLRARFPEARRILVVCGGGNNGGDGYVVARLAAADGREVQVVAVRPVDSLGGDARRAAEEWARPVAETADPKAFDVVVDALLGTGLDSEVREPMAGWIERINNSTTPVVAVDVPSGLDSDTGAAMGVAIKAAATVSFIGRKRGLHTGEAPRVCGCLVFNRLDVPSSVYVGVEPDATRLDPVDLPMLLPPRAADVHKGRLGHVLLMGGDRNFPGAVLLSARAALRCGSGLVSVATRGTHAIGLASGCPEAMWADGEDEDTVSELLERADVLAVGPGLGRCDWSRGLLDRALRFDGPMVLDADGLNLLSELSTARGRWILTPHPGEAARLLGTDTTSIQRDRFAAVRALARRFQAVTVLKGAGTLIACPDERVAVCPFGNPAMATAGMGDALTGIIASLVGQRLSLFDAARAGVLVHALAGDRAAVHRRTLLAGDLIEALPRVLP